MFSFAVQGWLAVLVWIRVPCERYHVMSKDIAQPPFVKPHPQRVPVNRPLQRKVTLLDIAKGCFRWVSNHSKLVASNCDCYRANQSPMSMQLAIATAFKKARLNRPANYGSPSDLYIYIYINMQIIVRPSSSKYLLHVADMLVISPSAQAKKKYQHQQGRRRSRLPCRRVNFWRPPRHWDVIPRI